MLAEIRHRKALEVHVKFTHHPDEETDQTAALMRQVLVDAGVEVSGEILIEEPIRLCTLTTHKPKAVGNLAGKEPAYDGNGYRKVRVTFDTGAGESVTPPGEFEEFEVKESEGSKRGWWYEGAHVDKEGNFLTYLIINV